MVLLFFMLKNLILLLSENSYHHIKTEPGRMIQHRQRRPSPGWGRIIWYTILLIGIIIAMNNMISITKHF